MATTTATIFVGKNHPYDSGIKATHLIFFNENDRPSLVLKSLSTPEDEVIMIPTLENTIDDIHLMITVFILKKIVPSKPLNTAEKKSLHEILDNKERIQLYNEIKTLLNESKIKVVFNILDGSHLLTQLDKIKTYPNNYEVTVCTMKKEYDGMSRKIRTKGI